MECPNRRSTLNHPSVGGRLNRIVTRLHFDWTAVYRTNLSLHCRTAAMAAAQHRVPSTTATLRTAPLPPIWTSKVVP
jgi:hypothetical protein